MRALWNERETTDFLERVSAAVGDSLALPNPMPQLAQLRDETWRAADVADPGLQGDVVALALRIDGLAARSEREHGWRRRVT